MQYLQSDPDGHAHKALAIRAKSRYDRGDYSGIQLMQGCIGILGGMGPLATVDLMRKIIAATPAARDQDHIPVIAYSVPQIPDRLESISAGDDAPWPYLLAGLRALERSGANAIVIACNTVHHWHARLQAETSLPILHIADAACDHMRRFCSPTRKIALLATAATVKLGFYQSRLRAHGYAVCTPDMTRQAAIAEAIQEVKAGNLTHARDLFEPVCATMLASGCDHLLLACTELPLALAGSPLDTVAIDATDALARAAVAWSLAARRPPMENELVNGYQVVGGLS